MTTRAMNPATRNFKERAAHDIREQCSGWCLIVCKMTDPYNPDLQVELDYEQFLLLL